MMDLSRAVSLIGEENLRKVQSSKVLLFGVGGVGSFIAEALIRSGINHLTIVDGDTVSPSNLNRQLLATSKNVGEVKVDVLKERLNLINPQAEITAIKLFFLPENSNEIDFSEFDYVIDAIDTVTAKIEIIKKAKENNVPVISSMGTGGKTDITKLRVEDISKTKVCPLAKVMRKELKDRGIKEVKVVYSEELTESFNAQEKTPSGRPVPSSMIFVPGAAGLMIAREVIFDLIGKK